MTRLVIAVLILFAVLIGLKAANPSFLQSNFLNPVNSTVPPTRNTGFSSDATGAASTNAGVSTSLTTPNGAGAATTPLPPRQLPAVPAGW